jgi:hypothetical protein
LITNYYSSSSLLASGFPRTTLSDLLLPCMCTIFKERRRFRQNRRFGWRGWWA